MFGWLWKISPSVSRFPGCWNVLAKLLEMQTGSRSPGEEAGGSGS